MNISKFTQKSIQAVQDLEKIAYEYGNQEVEQEHLLYSLLTQEDSLILKLIQKMEKGKYKQKDLEGLKLAIIRLQTTSDGILRAK